LLRTKINPKENFKLLTRKKIKKDCKLNQIIIKLSVLWGSNINKPMIV